MINGIDAGSWGEIMVGAVGLFLAIAIYRWSKRKPRIGYRIETKNIIQIDGVDTGEISISFKGHQIKTLVLCTVTIKNIGTFPIKKDDWQRPLELLFPESVEILDVRLPLMSPEDLGAEVSGGKENSIQLAPLLLNQGDGLIIELLITEDRRPTISTRVFDVEKIEEFDVEGRDLYFLKIYAINTLGLLLAGIAIIISSFFAIKNMYIWAVFAAVASAIGAFFTAIFASFFGRVRQMKLRVKKAKNKIS